MSSARETRSPSKRLGPCVCATLQRARHGGCAWTTHPGTGLQALRPPGCGPRTHAPPRAPFPMGDVVFGVLTRIRAAHLHVNHLSGGATWPAFHKGLLLLPAMTNGPAGRHRTHRCPGRHTASSRHCREAGAEAPWPDIVTQLRITPFCVLAQQLAKDERGPPGWGSGKEESI